MKDDGLKKFLKEVALNRFRSEPIKQEVKGGDRSLSIACPYCGDSVENPSNYRGHIYYKTKTYKCFNDGCFKWTTLMEFVSHWATEYAIDITDLEFDLNPDFDKDKVKVVLSDNSISDYIRDEGILDKLLDLDYFVNRFSLIPVMRLPEGSKVKAFIEARGLYSLPSISKYLYGDPRDDRVYIFNYDLHSGKVLSFSARMVDEQVALRKKYDTYTYSRLIEGLNINIDLDDIEIVDAFGQYFNIMNVNLDKPVTLLEGQFDSLFVENSIAISGLSKLKFILNYIDPDITKILFDNDIGGKRESLSMIYEGKQTFLWNLLIDKLKKRFPAFRNKIKKIKDINDLFLFLSGIVSDNMDMSSFNKMLNRHYSESIYDMYYI